MWLEASDLSGGDLEVISAYLAAMYTTGWRHDVLLSIVREGAFATGRAHIPGYLYAPVVARRHESIEVVVSESVLARLEILKKHGCRLELGGHPRPLSSSVIAAMMAELQCSGAWGASDEMLRGAVWFRSRKAGLHPIQLALATAEWDPAFTRLWMEVYSNVSMIDARVMNDLMDAQITVGQVRAKQYWDVSDEV